MSKGIKRMLTAVLATAMVATYCVPSVFADTTSDHPSEGTSTVEAATEVTSDLGMFTPVKGTVKYGKIDQDKATVEVTFTTKPGSRQYTKLALVRQEKRKSTKEAAAFDAKIEESEGKYSSTFTITVPVSKLGQKIPFSTYQKFTKKDGTAVDGWYPQSKQYYLTVKFTPELVKGLMGSIYDFTDHTGYKELCKAAKRGWDSLTEEEQNLKNEDGSSYYEFGYFEDEAETKGGAEYWTTDTGSAAEDDPRNANGIKSTELLVAGFGTNWNTTRALTIGGIEEAEEEAFTKYSVRRAFTSQIIINHIYARDGELIDNLQDALDRAQKNGVKTLIVQPTTLMHGTEYDNVVTGVNKNAKKFSKIVIAKPLCSTDKDKETVLKAIYEDAAKTSGMEVANAPTQTETAFVFMGHGTSHSNQVLYTQMQAKADKLGYKNCFIGTVEGKPASTSLESTIAKVKAAGYKKVVLRPLMIAAGDHANNDMAGDWGDAFTEAGFEVTSQIKGLGQLEAVQDLIVAHTKEAVAKLNKSAATIKSVKAGKKSATVKLNAAAVESVAGTKAYPTKYTVRYSTKKNMKGAKKVTTTKTTVKINKLKAKKTYYFQVSAQSATVKNGKFSASKKAKIK